MSVFVDGLQYANWSEKIFRQMRAGGLDAVHVTITYHENFRETGHNISTWNTSRLRGKQAAQQFSLVRRTPPA